MDIGKTSGICAQCDLADSQFVEKKYSNIFQTAAAQRSLISLFIGVATFLNLSNPRVYLL